MSSMFMLSTTDKEEKDIQQALFEIGAFMNEWRYDADQGADYLYCRFCGMESHNHTKDCSGMFLHNFLSAFLKKE